RVKLVLERLDYHREGQRHGGHGGVKGHGEGDGLRQLLDLDELDEIRVGWELHGIFQHAAAGIKLCRVHEDIGSFVGGEHTRVALAGYDSNGCKRVDNLQSIEVVRAGIRT